MKLSKKNRELLSDSDRIILNKNQEALSDHFYWKNRDSYLQLLDEFVNKKINGQELSYKYSILYSEDKNEVHKVIANLENQIDIKVDPNSAGFSELIFALFCHIDTFDCDFDDDVEESIYGIIISESYLRILIKTYFILKIQSYCE